MVGDLISCDSFRREVTPTWLATACVINGQRPPDLARPFRYVYIGCGRGVTSSVVAAVHPDCEVWAWDWRRGCAEATRRLRDIAGLGNLDVHERPGLPHDLGGGLVDFVVVDTVLVAANDELRRAILDAIAANLRPGGLACVRYKTTAGWSEIAPVQRLMRYVAERYVGGPDGLVDHVLELLASLRAGDAGHLVGRPSVAAWLDELAVTDDETIVAEYLADPFRPMSHPEVADAMSGVGCSFVGTARLVDDLDDDLPEALLEMVRTAPSSKLRQAYSDIAVRRMDRLDLFRCGPAAMPAAERASRLSALELAGTSRSRDDVPLDLDLDVAAWNRLQSGTVRASELGFGDEERLRVALRHLLQAGHAHPVAQGGLPRGSAAEASKVTATFDRPDASDRELIVAPLIGSAVVAARSDHDLLTRLGAC